jgi:transcriptional regulator with XRE-family HTH domain
MMFSESEQTDEFRFGARLRAAREAAGMTLQQVASATGLTKGYISQIERDISSPSITTLWRICTVLGVSVGDVTEPPGVPPEPIYRERLPLGGDPPNEHFSLSDYYDPRFFASESIVAPGGTLSDEAYSVPGDLEFVYVLAGRLEFEIQGRTYAFKAGEAFTYSIRDLHRWRNPSKTRSARILWVAVPNPYAPRRFGLGAMRAYREHARTARPS